MPAYNYSPAVSAAITTAALEYGVPIDLAFADAEVESGGNSNAVGDNGTSFGLYQLHEGGELGTLTPAQAEDPLTNARVALKQFGNVIRSYPNITDPGTIAAKAQRPADPVGYATKVDGVLNNYGTGTSVAPSNGVENVGLKVPNPLFIGLPPVTVPSTVTGAVGDTVGGALGFPTLPTNWPIRLGYLIVGGILGIIGLLAVGFTLGGGKIAKTAVDTLPEAALLSAIAKGQSAKPHITKLQKKYNPPPPKAPVRPKATPKPIGTTFSDSSTGLTASSPT